MTGKGTLIMKELAEEVGFKDMQLMGDLVSGFEVIGEFPDCAEYPYERVEATMG